MSATEFDDVLSAGNVLGRLVYGHARMRSEANFDVFHRFNVTTKGLNAIRACIRANGKLPDDATAKALVESGDLRHFADVLGGFQVVDDALEEREARNREAEARNREAETAHEHTLVDRPTKDCANVYEWRIISHHSTAHFNRENEALQAEGFVWVASEEKRLLCIEHYRRPWGGVSRREM